MSRIAGLLVRARRGWGATVRERLAATPGMEIVSATADGFAVVLEAPTAADQEAVHESIAARPEVEEALVVFQSGEVEG